MKTNKLHPLAKMAKVAAIMSMSALLMTSCGKNNEADSNATVNTEQVFSNPQQQAEYNSLKSQFPCDGGEQRIADIPLSLQTSGQQGGTLSGPLQLGHLGGQASDTFVGINYGFKDLLIISKVNNGGQISYNFTLSLCSKRVGQTWFIGGDSQLTGFQASGVLPVSSIGCSFGNVVNGNIAFQNSNFGGQDGRSFTQVCWQ